MNFRNLEQEKATIIKPMALFLAKVFLLLFLAGGMLGLLRQYDLFLAAMLGAGLFVWLGYVQQRMQRRDQFFAFLFGISLTAVLGIAAEIWGTTNGYWAYHDLSNGRHLAYWLPFAWAWAYIVLYASERYLLRLMPSISSKSKLLLVITLAAILPVFGEIAAIQSGVWTYYWPLQILGVPLLAIVLLVLLHCGIYGVMTIFCRSFSIPDPVYNTSAERGMRNAK